MRFKERYPLKYHYIKLRHSAKRRGIAFDLSYEDYAKFAAETGYDKLRGKHGYSLSIDRVNPALGYTISNIRAVRLATNTRLKYAPLPAHYREEIEQRERELAEQQSNEPF